MKMEKIECITKGDGREIACAAVWPLDGPEKINATAIALLTVVLIRELPSDILLWRIPSTLRKRIAEAFGSDPDEPKGTLFGIAVEWTAGEREA